MIRVKDWLRFWSNVEKGGHCWNWMGKHRPFGYGVFSLSGKNVFAHRTAYSWCRGTIPPKLTIDHLCRNRRCVNPSHLEVVTHVENTMRGFSPHAINARKTHCPRGHALVEENIYKRPDGRKLRECLTCRKAK